ncbi:MAG: hypothetical protein HKN87_21305 [Saprospiraceae bacterium]|nr:hypothetical protein [Saprospiraceae bacterium]
MNRLRSILILGLLCSYPLYSYLVTTLLGVNPNYLLGLVAYVLFAEVVITKFREDENLVVPPYLILFGLFALYVFASSLFVADKFQEVSIVKYLYEDPFLKSFAFIFVLENTLFHKGHIRIALQSLFFILIIASLVTLWQVYDPLFLRSEVVGNMASIPFERYSEYVMSLGPDYTEDVEFLAEGYRTSIYSWISGISVGLDSLAIFSILFGINEMGRIKRVIMLVCAGFISILSSARWIILNFLVIVSQRLMGKPSPLFSGLKLLFGLACIIGLVGLSASLVGFNISTFIENRLLAESAGTRIYAFKVFNQVYFDAPIFGTGGADTPEMLQLIQGRTSQIHVGWLKLIYYYGLVGALIYGGFVVSLLRHLYIRAKKSKYWGSFFAILAFVVANFTLVELSPLYHGLLLALIFSRYLTNVPPELDAMTKPTQLKPVLHPSGTPLRRQPVEV